MYRHRTDYIWVSHAAMYVRAYTEKCTDLNRISVRTCVCPYTINYFIECTIIIIYIPPLPPPQCKLQYGHAVNAQVLLRKRPPAQGNHNKCRLSVCASCWNEKHHQSTLLKVRGTGHQHPSAQVGAGGSNNTTCTWAQLRSMQVPMHKWWYICVCGRYMWQCWL